MCPPQIFRAALLLLAILAVACSGPDLATPDPGGTLALQTARPEHAPTEPPPGTIPPGFVFPVPVPLTEGNADIYAQRALFERTGSLCFHLDAERAGDLSFDGMAAKLDEDEGLLEDGDSYVGRLEHALPALDLEPVGIEIRDVAYGIGRVIHRRALPQLPAGTVWTPRLDRFALTDGRTGWTLNGSWIAVVDRACGVSPTTPG